MTKVSVIIPIRNEENSVQDMLDSIFANDFPVAEMEIIAVDGDSEDKTRELLEAFNWQGVRHQILHNPKKIVPVSLNLAIAAAKGKYIIRMDAHTRYGSDYIRRCVDLLESDVAENVGGPMRAVGRGPFGRAVALATSSRMGVGNASFHFEGVRGYVDTVYLGAFKREVFERFGGFDENLECNQDDEFNYRIKRGGGRIYLDPDIHSEYTPRNAPGKLMKQYFRYGYWKVSVIRKHGMPASWRHLAPAAFVLAVAAGAVISPFSMTVFSLWKGLIMCYLGACSIFSIQFFRENNLKTVAAIPFVFALLHLSYGLGFLKGALDHLHGSG
jgi:glycosyltransferase involved in cell wall biosynthesis